MPEPATTTDPAAVEIGSWYPCVPPYLEGEEEDAQTARLIRAAGNDHTLYDHARSRKCALGNHSECKASSEVCQCPHHTDTAPDPTLVTSGIRRAAEALACLWDLPLETTALKVAAVSARAIVVGTVSSEDALRLLLNSYYGTKVSREFVTDVAKALIRYYLPGWRIPRALTTQALSPGHRLGSRGSTLSTHYPTSRHVMSRHMTAFEEHRNEERR